MLYADHWHGGPWWGLWLAWMILFWGAVLFLIFRVARRRGPWGTWGPWQQERTGHSVLAERYARGEISEEEYRQRLAVLDAAARRPEDRGSR
jgi:putative membrane protein